MLLETAEAVDFRNICGSIHCGDGLNIFIGDNGQGKTNWLEGLYLLASARSFKTAKLQEAIRFGADLAIVAGRVRHSEDIHRDLRVALQANTKTLTVNGKREPLHDYLGQLHAVIFHSGTLEIVRGHPEARRRFLDEAIVSLHPPFVQTFSEFGRVIKQKNSLLQSWRDRDGAPEKAADLLEPWNLQLAALASRVHKWRVRVVERLNEMLEARLFGDEAVSIRYLSSLEGKGDLSDYEALISARLKLRIPAEIAAGHSLVGPQRDDLEILIDGKDIRKFASAGQQRGALLILQLANISVYYATRGEYPLLLLDDLDAELDHTRIALLLKFLEGKTQTFVTTSKAGFAAEFGSNSTVFRVKEGEPKLL